MLTFFRPACLPRITFRLSPNLEALSGLLFTPIGAGFKNSEKGAQSWNGHWRISGISYLVAHSFFFASSMIFVHFKYQSTSSKVKGSSFCFRLSSISSFICCTLHSFSFLNSSFLLVLAQIISLLIFLMAKASFLIFLKSKFYSESRSFWVWCRVNKRDVASKLCLDLRWWSIVKITRKLACGYFHSTVSVNDSMNIDEDYSHALWLIATNWLCSVPKTRPAV